ncbi:MAG: hypothetical protein WBA28_02870, partial [Microbacteriaceae bacterium]
MLLAGLVLGDFVGALLGSFATRVRVVFGPVLLLEDFATAVFAIAVFATAVFAIAGFLATVEGLTLGFLATRAVSVDAELLSAAGAFLGFSSTACVAAA